jgi:peptide/nickel transport system substrate-binding protein
MVEGHEVSADGRTWSIRLREGLKFHDGEPVLARDCAASFARWAARQSTGQVVGAFCRDWGVADDRTIKVTLKQALPTFAYLMAIAVPALRHAGAAGQDGAGQAGDGDGRLRAVPLQRRRVCDGSKVVYEKFRDYRPRAEAADWTAGGKHAQVDRLEWLIMPDKATQVAALQRGEVDWVESPPSDLLPVLKKNRDVTIDAIDPIGWTGFIRFNCLQKPFDNLKVRQAVMMAVDQEDYVRIVADDAPGSYAICKSVFPCGSALGRQLGAEAMRGDYRGRAGDAARSGYAGERVVLLQAVDLPPYNDYATVTAELLKKIGMNVDLVSSDWGTVTQRRAKMEPVEQGGWSIFIAGVNSPGRDQPDGELPGPRPGEARLFRLVPRTPRSSGWPRNGCCRGRRRIATGSPT